MVRPEGLEPPTYGFEARRSIQLSYGRTTTKIYHTGASVVASVVLGLTRPFVR